MRAGKTTIGTSSTQIVDSNPHRVSITFINSSDERIDISPGTDAVSQAGIPLMANGSGISFDQAGGTPVYKGPWFAICASGSKVLSYCEMSDGDFD